MRLNQFLFVCTANMLRSPTGEHVARRLGFTADSAGTESFAVRRLTKEAIDRAQRIWCMEQHHADAVIELSPNRADAVTCLNIPDDFNYCDRMLIETFEKLLEPYARVYYPRR